jgi:hypothetical protein
MVLRIVGFRHSTLFSKIAMIRHEQESCSRNRIAHFIFQLLNLDVPIAVNVDVTFRWIIILVAFIAMGSNNRALLRRHKDGMVLRIVGFRHSTLFSTRRCLQRSAMIRHERKSCSRSQRIVARFIFQLSKLDVPIAVAVDVEVAFRWIIVLVAFIAVGSNNRTLLSGHTDGMEHVFPKKGNQIPVMIDGRKGDETV